MSQTQNIPKQTFKYDLKDYRKRMSTRRLAVFLPLGTGATAVEGTPLIASQWDAELEAKMGNDPINKSMIDGFAQNTSKAQVTILPFIMKDPTSAKATMDLIYVDSALPGETNPTPSVTREGNLVFSINEDRYTIAVPQYERIENIVDALIAIITSDGQITATKKSITNGTTIDMTSISTGETANQTSFEWLVNDSDWVLPGNMTITDPLFSGGTESTDLSEKIALYKTELRYGGYTQFMSPYTESHSLKQIYNGFNQIWSDQIVNKLQFVPLLHIVVIAVETLLEAQEYAQDNAMLTLSIIPDRFKGDLAKRTGRINGDIFMVYQQNRLVNSMHLTCKNLSSTKYWSEQEADTLLGLGLSPLGESSNGEAMIIRLVSSYKESIDSQPISMLTSVLGAIWVITGIVNFNDAVLNGKYVLVNKQAGGNKITAAMLSIDLFNFITTNFSSGEDRVIDEFTTDQVSVIKVADNKVDCTISFVVPDGLTFINTTFLQILGG